MVKWIVLFYLFLEVIITITLGGKIGGLNTFLEMVLSALLGVVIMMNFKKVFMSNLAAVMSRQISAQQLIAGNFLALIGAVLLVLPGFLSDMVGILMQLGFIKNLLATRIKAPQPKEQNYTYKGDDDVIDVEIIEHNTTSK